MKFRETTDTSWAVLFDAQIKANSRRFFRLANNILRDGGAAEDACQQAFLTAWERREDLKTPTAIMGWLTKAVVNASLLAFRRRQRERRRVVPGESLLEVAAQTDGGRTDDLSSMHSSHDRREIILHATESLTELQRTIIVLRVIDERSGIETAEIVGCSPSVVSKQLHRSLERLRTLLAPFASELKE